MFDSILGFLHHATTLLFGVYVSAAFLGIQMKRKNVLVLFGFSCAVGLIYAVTFALFGDVVTTQVYPLIIHLPLIIFLTYFYKYKIVLAALSVTTAYLCCQISKWVGLVAFDITQLEWVYYFVRIVTTACVFVVLTRYVSNASSQLIQKPTAALWIFALMPFTYYLFDYITGVYTALLYSGKEVVAEFLGFVLCIVYLLFLLVYFKQYEEKREAEQQNRMMEMQRAQTQKEIEANKRSEHTVAILRHDMRHFLTNIQAYIDGGEVDKAKQYIGDIISAANQTAVRKYCKNEIVNMILSSHENKIKENGIDFKYSLEIPQKLAVSDVDITCILSNALENAIHAVLPLQADKRHITLELKMNDNKLLISVRNTYANKPEMAGGIPQSKNEGHGFGTQSIRYVAEKLNGNCQFLLKDEWFVLRVVL